MMYKTTNGWTPLLGLRHPGVLLQLHALSSSIKQFAGVANSMLGRKSPDNIGEERLPSGSDTRPLRASETSEGEPIVHPLFLPQEFAKMASETQFFSSLKRRASLRQES